YIHMSKGFILLAMALCPILLSSMFLSFWSVCRRLNKVDYVFSSLSIGIGFLIFFSMTLFVVNCVRLSPRPQEPCPISIKGCGATPRPSWSGGSATSAGPRDATSWGGTCHSARPSASRAPSPPCFCLQ
uniref:Uncharacterized protein n=1 Tax=Nannospalax galili TaxID=1026970 RepID=A0A8C6QVX8_NANGA